MYVCVRVSGAPGTGVTDGCELPCGSWELHWGPLEELSVFLTSEPSLQPWGRVFKVGGFPEVLQQVPTNQGAQAVRNVSLGPGALTPTLTVMAGVRGPVYMFRQTVA